MMPEQSALRGSIKTAAGIENQLSASLLASSDEVAHSEYLSVEQRSEVYSILHALQADTDRHKKTIRLLTGEKGGRQNA